MKLSSAPESSWLGEKADSEAGTTNLALNNGISRKLSEDAL